LQAIKEHFADDENASLVLMAWEEDMDGPAIQKDLGFSETTYRSTVRRIRRNAKKIMEDRS
jgi:DNA-directed RNA polymerase specialized sigma24 family protein